MPSGAKEFAWEPHCVVPSGLDLREILPGTPVPGYRLSRPFGTDSVECDSFPPPKPVPFKKRVLTQILKPVLCSVVNVRAEARPLQESEFSLGLFKPLLELIRRDSFSAFGPAHTRRYRVRS